MENETDIEIDYEPQDSQSVADKFTEWHYENLKQAKMEEREMLQGLLAVAGLLTEYGSKLQRFEYSSKLCFIEEFKQAIHDAEDRIALARDIAEAVLNDQPIPTEQPYPTLWERILNRLFR
jgi:molecular chaperone DnaK (HSP70)